MKPDHVFAHEAPHYWKAGLPAIPLMVAQKRPAIQRWQLFADTIPTEEEKSVWLDNFPNGNIGLPMGPASGLVAVDIDTDDPAIIGVLESILPPTPWNRIGKKGMIRIYRYAGERTARIKHSDGSMICEILSKGTQIVLPPSIHPDTQRPYTADSRLYEVFKSVPALPHGILDLIRGGLGDLGFATPSGSQSNKITDFVSAGARDNTMVWHAGLLARAVGRGERTLPQALGEMEQWVSTFVEAVIGDPLSIDKARMKVVEFLVRDVTGERRKALPSGWDEGLGDEDKQKLGLSFTDEDEQWSATRILEYLAAEFERFPDYHDDGRTTAIQVALDRLARAGAEISTLDEDRVTRFILGQNPKVYTATAIKRELTDKRRGDIAGENHEEVAQAVLRHLKPFGEVRFDGGSFWQWKGAFWERTKDHALLRTVAEDFGFYTACRRDSDYKGVLNVMRSISAKPLAPQTVRGLNFANGFLSEDLKLTPHHPDHGMIYVLPYRYDANLAGHMPMFSQYLADSWGQDPDYPEKLAALQEAMGATLFGCAPNYQRAILLHGPGGSGKSVMMSILTGLLPPNSVSSIPPQEWSDKFLPAMMFGKVLNVAGELSETKSISGDIFKQVVVGEMISAQNKNEPPFNFKPVCAQWFSSNFLPKTKDLSGGFTRRWLILGWNRKVEDAKKIIDLDRVILEFEREGIAAWAVEGLLRLRDNNEYSLPKSHFDRLLEMSAANDSVYHFLLSYPGIAVGKKETDGDVDLKRLYDTYTSFGIGARRPREDFLRFTSLLEEHQTTFDFLVEREDREEGICRHIAFRPVATRR